MGNPGDPVGTRIDGPAIASAATTLRAILGDELVARAIANLGQKDGAPGLDLVRGFGLVDSWVESLESSREPPEADLMLRFVMVATVISAASEIEGASAWIDRIRSHALSSNPDLFYQTLFEGEVATYWLEEVSRGTRAAKFGPPAAHPDLWLPLPTLAGSVEAPAECKRIRQASREDASLREFGEQLDAGVSDLARSFFPMVVTVWLHREARDIMASEVIELIRGVAAQPREGLRWQTGSDADASVQVSVRPFASNGEFVSPPIGVPDVEARPFMASRVEVSRRPDGDSVHPTSVLSVRSDVTSDRIGRLSSNFRKAAHDQLPKAGSPVPGIVSLRVRRPRALGDLFEMDRLIRGEIARCDHTDVGLAVFFWDERERLEDEAEHVGEHGVEKTIAYHLRSYFIPHPKLPGYRELDSYAQYFGEFSAPVIRDPVAGSMKPVDAATMAILEGGGELPEQLQNALDSLEPLDPTSGSATIYLALRGSLGGGGGDALIGVLSAGNRQFRVFIDRYQHLKVLEIRHARPVGIATIDLRAWTHELELCVAVSWGGDGFRAGVRYKDDSGYLWARSTHVRRPAWE